MLLAAGSAAPLQPFAAVAKGARILTRNVLSCVRNAPSWSTFSVQKRMPLRDADAVCPDTISGMIRDLGTALERADGYRATSLALIAHRAHAPVLDAAALVALRKACKAEINAQSAGRLPEIQRMRLQALDDHARLGLQPVRIAQSQRRWCARLKHMSAPGAHRGTFFGCSAHAGAGLTLAGAGATAGLSFGAQAGSKSTCFETLEYVRGRQRLISAEVSADGQLAPGLAAGAGLTASVDHTRYDAAASVDDYAAFRARRAVATPLRSRLGHRLLTIVSLGRATPRDRVAHAARAALRWAPLMPTLVSCGGGDDRACSAALTQEALLPSPAPLLDIGVRTRTISLQAAANAAIAHAGVSAGRSRLRVDIDLPLWLADLDLDEPQRDALAWELRERITAGLGTHAERFSALHADDADPAAAREEALQRLHTEFQCLQSLLLERQRGIDKRQIKRVLARTCETWNCRTPQRALTRMLELANWLWLVMPADQRNAARALISTLRASPVLRQDAASLRPLYVHQTLQQFIRSDTLLVKGGTSQAADSVGATDVSIRISRSHQRNYNALRDGTYVEADITLTGSTSTDAILTLLQQRLPDAGWAADTTHELRRVLNDAGALSLAGTAAVTVGVRFFRPSFQDDVRFPAAARGLHMQQITVRGASTFKVGGRVPVVGIPLSALGLAARLQHERHTVLRADIFCGATLTASLLRYQCLIGQRMAPAQAWQKMLDDHGSSLADLAHRIAEKSSSARAEACHWLLPPAPAAGHDADGLITAAGVLQPRLPGLHALFDALLPPLAEAQRQSPLCHPVALAATQRRNTRPWRVKW